MKDAQLFLGASTGDTEDWLENNAQSSSLFDHGAFIMMFI